MVSTVIWSCFALAFFIKNDLKSMIFFTLLMMNFQCVNILEIGSLYVGPQLLTSILFIIKFFIYNKGKIRILKNKKIKFSNFLLNLMILTIIISSLFNKVISFNYLSIIKIFIYVITFFCMQIAFEDLDEKEVYKIIRKIIKIILFIGILQWLTTNNILPLRKILKLLFYNDNSKNIYFNYNDKYHNIRVYSTFMEPSYLAGFLVGSLFYLCSFSKELKSNLLLLIIIVIEILFTTSSTAYGTLLIVGLVYLIFSDNLTLRTKMLISILAIILYLIMYFGFYDILDKVIFSKMNSGSGKTRIRWNNECWEAFKTSKLIGIGFKNIRGSSIIFSLLGELGIIGLLIFLGINLVNIYNIFNKKSYKLFSNGYIGAMYAVFSNFVSQIIACPDLDLCSLWFWMYVLAIYEGMSLNKDFIKEGRNYNEKEKN